LIVLAIDTATEILSVALRTDLPPLPCLYSATRDTGLKHSSILMPLVSSLLTDARLKLEEVDLVACTRGPGSFTGLRIGMATSKGLAAAIASARAMDDPPLISVSTLEVIASALPADESMIVPVIDGRKNRFYAAVFQAGSRLTTDLDLPADQIMDRVAEAMRPDSETGQPRPQGALRARVIITGPHAQLFASRLDDRSRFVVDPASRRGHAENLLPLAATEYQENGPDAPDQGPVYVRDSDAQLSRRNE